MSIPAVEKHSWRHADICQSHSLTHSSITSRTQSLSSSSGMEEHRHHHHHHHYHHHHHHHHSIPRLILDNISAKSPKRAGAITGSEKNQITVPESSIAIMGTAKYSPNKLQISGRAQSVPDPPKKNNISSYFRTYSQHSGNFLSPKTRKKPLLTRTEAIDETCSNRRSSVSSSTDSSQINKNPKMGKMSGDIRSHLFMSFFTRQFGKMHRKMARRPLGASSSCDLEERQEKNSLRRGHVSEDSNSPYSLTLLNHPSQLHSGLNCFHCLIDISSRERENDISLRERELTKEPQKMTQLLSGFDSPSVKGTATLCNTSQNSHINCKISLHHDDSIVINAGISPSVASSPLSNMPISAYFADDDHHFLSSSLLSTRKLYGSSDCLARLYQDTNRSSHIQRTKSLNSLKNYKNDSTGMLSSSTSTSTILSSTASNNIELHVSSTEDNHGYGYALMASLPAI